MSTNVYIGEMKETNFAQREKVRKKTKFAKKNRKFAKRQKVRKETESLQRDGKLG